MKKIEWKKINYIFSVNNNVQESIRELNLTDDSILYVGGLIKSYNNNVKTKIKNNMTINDKKKIIEEFLKEVPSQLMILRNHLKNCIYATDNDDFKYKYEKYVDDDFVRLSYIRH